MTERGLNSQRELISSAQHVNPEIAELENYSITSDSESSVFFLHLTTIFKKKILMQIRDTKTLLVDTIFPIALIILGMYLATIQVIKSGQAREMSVQSIYPSPIKFFYNTESPSNGNLNSNNAVKSFIDYAFIKQDATTFEDGGTVQSPSGSLLKRIVDYDQLIFAKAEKGEILPSYG